MTAHERQLAPSKTVIYGASLAVVLVFGALGLWLETVGVALGVVGGLWFVAWLLRSPRDFPDDWIELSALSLLLPASIALLVGGLLALFL